MDIEELMNHQEIMRPIKKDLNFTIKNTVEVQDQDGE
jgi:hypothetical protein